MTTKRAEVVQGLRLLGLLGFMAACGSSNSPSSPTGSTPVATATPTAAPTPSPTATPAPVPTATPTAICDLTLTQATFDPQRVNCPGGTSTQTMRLVFDLSASGGLPITINRVSTSGARCQASAATCTWPDGPLSYSQSVVSAGTTAHIVATTQFNCGSGGSPASGALVTFEKLFVNTSCGAAREITLTNGFTIGF
ncbi:MAG: hypothetical protein ABI672_05690 [Vicinamibacteria bacterium]